VNQASKVESESLAVGQDTPGYGAPTGVAVPAHQCELAAVGVQPDKANPSLRAWRGARARSISPNTIRHLFRQTRSTTGRNRRER